MTEEVAGNIVNGGIGLLLVLVAGFTMGVVLENQDASKRDYIITFQQVPKVFLLLICIIMLFGGGSMVAKGWI